MTMLYLDLEQDANERFSAGIIGEPYSTCPEDLSVIVRLDQPDEIVPLDLTGTQFSSWRNSKIGFDISIDSSCSLPTEETKISVFNNGTLMAEETFVSSEHNKIGHSTWYWDGYRQGQVLNTGFLVGDSLRVTASVTRGGLTRTSSIRLRAKYKRVKWADVRVDLPNSQVTIDVFVRCTANDDLVGDPFKRLMDLGIGGIGKYWSRMLRVDGVEYATVVNAMQRGGNSEKMPIDIETKTDYARSYNSGVVGIGGVVHYNMGYYAYNSQRADADFESVFAHEWGHSVLLAYGGYGLSWGHKGPTGANPITFWDFQKPNKSATGYPSVGEIDLMKYYTGSRPPENDYYSRLRVANEDLIRLIALTAMEFEQL